MQPESYTWVPADYTGLAHEPTQPNGITHVARRLVESGYLYVTLMPVWPYPDPFGRVAVLIATPSGSFTRQHHYERSGADRSSLEELVDEMVTEFGEMHRRGGWLRILPLLLP